MFGQNGGAQFTYDGFRFFIDKGACRTGSRLRDWGFRLGWWWWWWFRRNPTLRSEGLGRSSLSRSPHCFLHFLGNSFHFRLGGSTRSHGYAPRRFLAEILAHSLWFTYKKELYKLTFWCQSILNKKERGREYEEEGDVGVHLCLLNK
jgi:hypothetical protein